jgi:hypothetical protein
MVCRLGLPPSTCATLKEMMSGVGLSIYICVTYRVTTIEWVLLWCMVLNSITRSSEKPYKG